MTKTRLEAFSDGVVAILITIMVLELHVPHEPTWDAIQPLVPTFLTYVLSYVFLGIYWNNHHHMMHASERINGKVLWANLHLLFWLSLIPFVTGWMGQNHFESLPTAAYGTVMLLAAVAYYILAHALLAAQGPDSRLARALGRDRKGQVSVVLWAIGIILSFVTEWTAIAIYIAVALMWLIPDTRIEKSQGDSRKAEA
jgi:uncharacterized membrane protein